MRELKIIKDLRNLFGEIKDQGTRPTCMAFTATDCHSFARGRQEEFSTEYAFFHAVQRTLAKDRTMGIPFEIMSKVIWVDGQPKEQDWVYLKDLKPSDPWVVPGTIGNIFCRRSTKIKTTIDALCDALNDDLPVIMVVDISISFFHLKGSSVLPEHIGEARKNTHAILAVGYGELGKQKCFLVRNSWGEGWADRGYGWINEEYLRPRLHVAAVMN